jgi:hypothetical protein
MAEADDRALGPVDEKLGAGVWPSVIEVLRRVVVKQSAERGYFMK